MNNQTSQMLDPADEELTHLCILLSRKNLNGAIQQLWADIGNLKRILDFLYFDIELTEQQHQVLSAIWMDISCLDQQLSQTVPEIDDLLNRYENSPDVQAAGKDFYPIERRLSE